MYENNQSSVEAYKSYNDTCLRRKESTETDRHSSKVSSVSLSKKGAIGRFTKTSEK